MKESLTVYGFEGHDYRYTRKERYDQNNIVMVFAALGRIEREGEAALKSAEVRWSEHKLLYIHDHQSTWDEIRHTNQELFDQVIELSMRFIQINKDDNHWQNIERGAHLFKKWTASKERKRLFEEHKVVTAVMKPLLGEACAKLEEGGIPSEVVDWMCA